MQQNTPASVGSQGAAAVGALPSAGSGYLFFRREKEAAWQGEPLSKKQKLKRPVQLRLPAAGFSPGRTVLPFVFVHLFFLFSIFGVYTSGRS